MFTKMGGKHPSDEYEGNLIDGNQVHLEGSENKGTPKSSILDWEFPS